MHDIDKKAFSAAIEATSGEFPPESGITYDVLQRLCAAYHEAAKASVSRELEVLKSVVRFADGRCWPEVQAAIDANRKIVEYVD